MFPSEPILIQQSNLSKIKSSESKSKGNGKGNKAVSRALQLSFISEGGLYATECTLERLGVASFIVFHLSPIPRPVSMR